MGPAQGVVGASAEKCGWFWCCIVKTERKIFVRERERVRVRNGERNKRVIEREGVVGKTREIEGYFARCV